ncbi:uncharacterized protein ACA1_074480 [Acanthamoeba castellanii str. Neff]|uniref:Kazaltype serine protease inhibitor domain containing protein n=1 Tax=Acanthamoeba castellanii (strain ATCC 30010 / Neff) TaxID=1257118 RepID=L8HHE1_ACACF|nr:uncharacterized protein ACA1_074480 [Acanthamoeba castellanii str. Neff]ELR23881.1 hypothetical protein ACA1_074480 [Acanthamoeba castellanii str. Neff]
MVNPAKLVGQRSLFSSNNQNLPRINIPHNGRDCWADSECNSSVEYCKRRVGHCNSEGFCASRPTDCASTGTPVCTCTGETLENDCSAAAAGVTVAYEGECTN